MVGFKVRSAILVALLVIGVSCMDEEMAELAKIVRESCVAEIGVDLSLIDKVNGGADLMPDGKLKCYMKCVMETAGMMSDGEVDVEAVLAIMPEDFQARNGAMMRQCGTKKGADDCDTAYLTQQCWQQGSPKDYILV